MASTLVVDNLKLDMPESVVELVRGRDVQHKSITVGPSSLDVRDDNHLDMAEVKDELGDGVERNLAGASDRGVPNSIGAGADGEGATRELSDRSGRPGFATYVHPSLAGRDDTARGDGEKYWPWDREYIASISYPLGTVLEVRHNSNVLIGVVKDRGLLAPNQVDLSEAGFLALAGRLGTGVISVTIREVMQ